MQSQTPLQKVFDSPALLCRLTAHEEQSHVQAAGRQFLSTGMQSVVGKDKDYVPSCRPF